MCTLSQGLFEKGYEMGYEMGLRAYQNKLEALMAEQARLLKAVALGMHRLHRLGMSPEEIGQKLNMPTEKVLNVLAQASPTVGHTTP